ncbi:MBL fold metallo-hydrolase [Marinobacter sp. CHS3-4]|uniref:MBL fold metallo-hydrolase n=1 Tax=Marinobacter sp. CHS3-4 TaxID=3045174 RepID=UPI0024B530D4|nr:MBL fold metallo-hydrolase [Marinobacter sp. CHS3-4]MDI9245368.1 MBL fold metallo-hydrolase [Marinobacter sp. CHS3-4]
MIQKILRSCIRISLAITACSAHGHDQIQHIRNATVKIDYAGVTFLVDPLLARKEAYPGLPGTFNAETRYPTVELPLPTSQIVEGVDAVIVTHTHPDHWDQAAQTLLPKDTRLFVQNNADANIIRSQEFRNVEVLNESTIFKGVELYKTGGCHAPEFLYSVETIAAILGEVMGVVMKAPNRKTIYLAGDTVWCEEVEVALKTYRPDITVLNAGKAMLDGLEEFPILMGELDVLRVVNAASDTQIIAVHLEALNHSTLSRSQLRTFVNANGLEGRVLVPEDGEVTRF